MDALATDAEIAKGRLDIRMAFDFGAYALGNRCVVQRDCSAPGSFPPSELQIYLAETAARFTGSRDVPTVLAAKSAADSVFGGFSDDPPAEEPRFNGGAAIALLHKLRQTNPANHLASRIRVPPTAQNRSGL
jgi:hypothetical protein